MLRLLQEVVNIWRAVSTTSHTKRSSDHAQVWVRSPILVTAYTASHLHGVRAYMTTTQQDAQILGPDFSKPWTQSFSLGATMSNHSIHDMRRPRRNTVSEIPFAGRIGGFQQEIADDEKDREILKNQPDAVCPLLHCDENYRQHTNKARHPSTQSAMRSIHQASSSSTTGRWP